MTDKEKNIADRLKDIAEECYKDKELMPISVILFSLLGALYGGKTISFMQYVMKFVKDKIAEHKN